jgi:hypothetical protein
LGQSRLLAHALELLLVGLKRSLDLDSFVAWVTTAVWADYGAEVRAETQIAMRSLTEKQYTAFHMARLRFLAVSDTYQMDCSGAMLEAFVDPMSQVQSCLQIQCRLEGGLGTRDAAGNQALL